VSDAANHLGGDLRCVSVKITWFSDPRSSTTSGRVQARVLRFAVALFEVGRPDAEDQCPDSAADDDREVKRHPQTRSLIAVSASTRFIDGSRQTMVEEVHRTMEQILRGIELLQQAVPEHGDSLPERHRLDLVVRDIDGRDAEPLVQLRELRAHRHAQLCIEAEMYRPSGTLSARARCPPHRDLLALAA
jgi:hypothetical protein